MKKLVTLLFLTITLGKLAKAQEFTLDADIRPRFEYRHGFSSLYADEAKPAAFVTQRSRLNFAFKDQKWSLYFSAQDVSTWGDTQQLSATDGNNSFSIFQGWIRYAFDENWGIKLGRQVLSYDDQRILGATDWAMQGRTHDAAMLQFSRNKFDLDLAFAFNQEGQYNFGTDYTIRGGFSYKTMQMAHLTKAWDQATFSFLFMNTGFQKYTNDPIPQTDGLYYRQTTGTYYSFPISFLTITGSAYLQSGMANAATDLSAYQYMIEAKYKAGKVTLIAGFESLSGTDQAGEDKNKSFFPLYGTNHKFNGFMDYFYVGNHANNVGLNDFYGKVQLAVASKGNLGLDLHYFSANAELADDFSKNLGAELDLYYSHSLGQYVKIAGGYSQLFATESMSVLKGGVTSDNTNNWGWVQLIVNPRLLTYKVKGE
ncbi:alginate export family protein [Algoriphagus halophytocola]|uniref:Alginate export family protein n=1 Tax=Algoriphagus halophytocola TaxID=2991499 RepID=A0ABY6MCQ3_9BACT|nr:alginate export family protein [Algoriphagus sp. TR-M5]UZD21488.1 alginate export family protein [Algoriphagus sp. TR-M5]